MKSSELYILIAAAVIVLSAFNWRLAIKTVLIMVIIEGVLRKWVFPQASQFLYFAKDFVLLGGYIGYLLDQNARRIPMVSVPFLIPLLAVGAWIGAMQVFNVNLPSPVLGILGFKSYFIYIPLLFVVPRMFATQQEVAIFLRRYLMLLIPVAILGLIQFYSPAGSIINMYVQTQEGIAVFGEKSHVRVTSTFSYITGYVSYLMFSLLLVVGYISGTKWRFRGNILMYIVLGLAIIALPMTGSRWPIFMLMLLAPIFIVIQVKTGAMSFAVGMRSVAALAALGFLMVTYAPDVLQAFSQRATGERDTSSRVFTVFEQPYDALFNAGIFGYGIGATHNSAPALFKDRAPYEWLDGHLYEEETARVMLEVGIFGFVPVFLLRAYLVLLSYRLIRSARDMFNRSLATVFFLYFLAHLNAQVIMNPTAGVLYWFTAGLLFLVLRFEMESLPSHA